MGTEIYQIDLAALRGYNKFLADQFALPEVNLAGVPYWSPLCETLMIAIVSVIGNGSALVPCDWILPNPAPTFRFIVTAANGTPISDDTVQGIPREYANYAPILLREGFEWVGINYGSQRVSIERVSVPPLGESSDS